MLGHGNWQAMLYMNFMEQPLRRSNLSQQALVRTAMHPSAMFRLSGASHLYMRTTQSDTCYPKGCAATRESAGLVQHMKAPEQAQKDTSPRKINVTSKSPVGDISVVTLIRTDTTLDHSQKAEKVC
jgi:hypothetical protein